jgi:6-phosphogluconate dehydrogenase (decarboxylating)
MLIPTSAVPIVALGAAAAYLFVRRRRFLEAQASPQATNLGPSSGPLAVTPDKIGTADVGIIGLAVMGPNLALNLLDRGFTVAVWNLEKEACEKFVTENAPKYGAHKIVGAETYEGFAALLRRPRKTLILVMAGKPTDMVIDNLMRVGDPGDVIVDTGNAHFKEQTRRAELVESRGMRFLGMGISGGAEGARKGPAFFPGGTRSVWEDIKPIVEAAAAKAADGRPCVTMCGIKGAGTCVKMYHNAGEYAVLQIWAEVVAAMRSMGLEGKAIREVLASWKAKGPLDSYMLDSASRTSLHPRGPTAIASRRTSLARSVPHARPCLLAHHPDSRASGFTALGTHGFPARACWQSRWRWLPRRRSITREGCCSTRSPT